MIFLFVNEIPLPNNNNNNNKRKPQQAENNERMQDSKDHSNSLPECSKSSWLKKHPNFSKGSGIYSLGHS